MIWNTPKVFVKGIAFKNEKEKRLRRIHPGGRILENNNDFDLFLLLWYHFL